jgi:hypothetical protein
MLMGILENQMIDKVRQPRAIILFLAPKRVQIEPQTKRLLLIKTVTGKITIREMEKMDLNQKDMQIY